MTAAATRLRGGGCVASRPAVGADDAPPTMDDIGDLHLATEERDPRWDIAGFNAAFEELQIGSVRVGYLRKFCHTGGELPRRSMLSVNETTFHLGAPPAGVQLYAVDYCWYSRQKPEDPERTRLKKLVEVLDKDGAFDDDLVFWDWASVWMLNDHDTEHDSLRQKQITAWASYCSTHFRIKMIIIPDAPLSAERAETSYFERLWCLHGFSVSTFTQRIVNSANPIVSAHMTPEWLMNTSSKLNDAACTVEADRKGIMSVRATLAHRMPPARTDAKGFQTVCRVANFRWVLVSFVHQLAERGGPAPRRQELPAGSYIEGIVPIDRQPWVVSYAWASVQHFSPSGAKIKELSSALRALGAAMTDVVFLDHMSLWQTGRELPQAYAVQNGVIDQMVDYRYGRVKQADMTKGQEKEMRFALYESTRLYAFAGGKLPNGRLVPGCKVLVLPRIEVPESFPDCGEITTALNEFCHPPREEKLSAWGFCKSLKYHQGGWTCAEYSVARKNGTIANASHEDVREVEIAREWPDDVAAYALMMDEASEKPVAFTRKGDREAVRFNFFKYVYSFDNVSADSAGHEA